MALQHALDVPNRRLQPVLCMSLGLGACPCCTKPQRLQLELRPNAVDDLAHGMMLAVNRARVMRLATTRSFAAAPPAPQQAGSETLGGHSRNGRVQNCTLHRGAPSPSLGVRGAKLAICLILECVAVVRVVVGET